MTSMAAESVATILCTAKQTRFNIDSSSYREVRHKGTVDPMIPVNRRE